jgi:hypothetical protein
MGVVGSRFLVALFVLLLTACGSAPVSLGASPSPSGSPPVTPSARLSNSPSPSGSPVVPQGWKTLNDSTYGYVFSYPGDWTDLTQAEGIPAGAHAIASRASLTNLLTMEPTDKFLNVMVGPPHPLLGCSEPVSPDEKVGIILDGQTATDFARKGTQSDPNVWVLDLIALYSGTCYHFQLMTGSAIPENDAKAMLGEIQLSFSFGVLAGSPTPTASADIAAVAAQLYGPEGSFPCITASVPRYDRCPMTPELRSRLTNWVINAIPLCRCQNSWQAVAINVTMRGAQPVAEVDLYFGAGTYVRFDLYMVSAHGQWLVSDIRCRDGDATTSVFTQYPPLC